jgi:hypothetical protein
MDGRHAQPLWCADGALTVRMRKHVSAIATAHVFSIWSLPGRKSLTHDGGLLQLTASTGLQALRVAIDADLAHGDTFAYVISACDEMATQWRAVQSFADVVGRKPPVAASHATEPGRQSIVHTRALQALDGVLHGATQREIAEALFGPADVAGRWSADGELRAQVRHLIRRGRSLMSGEYLRLLGAGR